MLVLRFFGGASIEGPQGPVVGPAAQARRLAFLSILAVARGQPVSRDKVIGLLWPESSPDSARHSVRNTIYVLNHELEDAPVEILGDTLRIDPARCASDVAAFRSAIECGDLEQAVGHYSGEFLDGLFIKDALEFEQWVREERDQCARAYAQALEELANRAGQSGDHSRAAPWWRELIAHDPYSDRATVGLMESLIAAGDRAEALRQADAYAVLMRETFDVDADRAVTELARRLREESPRKPTIDAPVVSPRRWLAPPKGLPRWQLAAAMTVILGVVAWYVGLRDVWPGPAQAPGADAAPAIAVLPFTVRGDELGVLREGMVDLLSTGLDGVGGLRTIPAGTLLARWRGHVPGARSPELATALEVASQVRAHYALVGSVVAVGSDVRMVVDVYDLNTDQRLGQARVEGSPDDVLPLVDRLVIEVLGIILQKGENELPEINLASLTTSSPEALQAFLEGEVHFRQMDLEEAEEAYERAVRADADFAYAHWRLAKVYTWKPTGGAMAGSSALLAAEHRRRALELADRLPKREASILRANWNSHRRLPEAIDSLRALVRKYPDDALAWSELSVLLRHRPGALASAEEVDRTIERAVELNPRKAEYRVPYYEYAWMIHSDSVEAVRRRGAYGWDLLLEAGVHGADSTQLIYNLLAFDLAFGDSTVQADAIARMSEERAALGESGLPCERVNHPRFYDAGVACYGLYLELCQPDQPPLRDCSGPAFQLFRIHARWRGRVSDGLRYLEAPLMTPSARAAAAYQAFATGLPIPLETLEEVLDPGVIDTPPGFITWFDADRHMGALYAGAYAADRGRWSDHTRAVAALERRAARVFAEVDSMSLVRDERGKSAGETPLHLAAAAKALKGYGLWRRGQPNAALPALEDWRALHYWIVRWWLGGLYQELGRPRDAERVYRSWTYMNPISVDPQVQRALGSIYEQLGEYDMAQEAYAYFIEAWENADPELQPLVEEARQAVIRLKGLQRK